MRKRVNFFTSYYNINIQNITTHLFHFFSEKITTIIFNNPEIMH